MLNTPKGNRLHIAIFGRRNAGKSSLLNALTRQDVSIVSDVPGTTTDPVEKTMELLPLGPVVFIDTAGLDDVGALGEQRARKSRMVMERTDLALLVTTAASWGDFEEELLASFAERKVTTVVVFNKSDSESPPAERLAEFKARKLATVVVSARTGEGVLDLREAILRAAPEDFLGSVPLVSDLVPPGKVALLVTPIDMEAPKGRLILPQVQTIRDILDGDSMVMVVKERELAPALATLREPPALVITDSQAFLKVGADVPPEIPMTSFSILFARIKGDLVEFVKGASAIEKLRAGSRVLIAESCTHHAIGDDIGRVKIPRWLRQYSGANLTIDHAAGHDFPENLPSYDLVVHCGGCMNNRREILSRILRCRDAQVPVTNYGLAIAYSLGIFERALAPFPSALDVWRSGQDLR